MLNALICKLKAQYMPHAKLSTAHFTQQVPINDIVGDEDDAEEVIIFDLTTLEHNTLEDGNHISQTDEKFQPKSLRMFGFCFFLFVHSNT